MFEKIYVSQSVYDEVKQSGMCYLMAQIEELIRTKFIITKKCDNVALVNSLMSFLGSGEAETITLALELKDIEVVING
jgi:predicted nucleic acid-binding protein